MGLFTGKRGVIMGVANDHSLAWGIAQVLHKEGAQIAFNHLPDKEGRNRNETRVRKLTDTLANSFIAPCDVSSDDEIDQFFALVAKEYGQIDFFVHSIAFANATDIKGATIDCSREGFKLAMDISCYSYIATAKRAASIMREGGSMLALSYFGGEKVVAGYNMMGICKAALEMAVRYLAFDLGERGIRSNAISAGPVRTLAASAVGDFREMLQLYESVSPLGRNVTPEDVGHSAAYLLSEQSRATTGEILHVDSGYHCMGSPGRAAERLKDKG